MAKPRLLVTGGTGFLGKHVVPRLREWAIVDVLSRNGGTGENLLRGDLSRWNADLDLEMLEETRYDLCLHMAGLYDLRASREDCCIQNTFATSTILKVAQALKIPRVMQTSSVAAMINTPRPTVAVDDFPSGRPFPDAYSESKSQTEKILMSANGAFTHKINLRLGILVGDTAEGKIDRIDGPYCLAESLRKHRLLIEALPTSVPVPGDEKRRLPLVPVDAAALAISRLAQYFLKAEPTSTTLHLTPNLGVSHQELYLSSLKHLRIKNRGVRLTNVGSRDLLARTVCRMLGFPLEEFYYFMKLPRYEVKSTVDILGPSWCPEFKSYEKVMWRGYEKYLSNP